MQYLVPPAIDYIIVTNQEKIIEMPYTVSTCLILKTCYVMVLSSFLTYKNTTPVENIGYKLGLSLVKLSIPASAEFVTRSIHEFILMVTTI